MAAFLLKVLMAAALVGTIGAVAALARGAAGAELLPVWHGTLVITCGVISVIGLAVLSLSVQQRLAGKDRKKLLVGGAPRWMRWLTTTMSLVGMALWFLLIFRHYQPPHGGVPSLVVGAFGLFVFPSVFSSTFSYSRRRAALNRRCSAGHEVPIDAAFCPLCGATLEPVA